MGLGVLIDAAKLRTFGAILYTSFLLLVFSGPAGPYAIAFVVGIYLTGIIGFWIA